MMKSPFPGMDPFLEDKAEWPSVHTWLIAELATELGNAVAPDFFVRIEQRVYITALDNPDDKGVIAPDVFIMSDPVYPSSSTTTMAAAIMTPTLVEPASDLEIYDRYIEIRDVRNREIITTIELLSPFNKAPGHQGYDAFQRKRRQVMASPVHWIEIDLLRAGERPLELFGRSDYYALLKRGHAPGPFEVWQFDLRDRMPVIGVPLRDPFPDVPLDLQAAFDQIYARAHYANSLDYTRPVPMPHLRPADVNWVNSRIQSWQRDQEQR